MAAVVMLSGPIGAGKTTVAHELVALWQGPLAYIEGDQFWPFLVKRPDGDPRKNFPAVMRAMTSAAASLARSGYDVLLDFSIPPQFLPTALKIARDVELDYVLLLPELEVCAARAGARHAGKIAKYDKGFYALFTADERHVVSDPQAEPRVIAEFVQVGLDAGRFRVETPLETGQGGQ
jgi:chloramphenicol 3-O-phosphotransferase